VKHDFLTGFNTCTVGKYFYKIRVTGYGDTETRHIHLCAAVLKHGALEQDFSMYRKIRCEANSKQATRLLLPFGGLIHWEDGRRKTHRSFQSRFHPSKGCREGQRACSKYKMLETYEEESGRMPSRSGVARVVGGLIQQAPIGPESGVRGAITPTNKGKNKKQTLIH